MWKKTNDLEKEIFFFDRKKQMKIYKYLSEGNIRSIKKCAKLQGQTEIITYKAWKQHVIDQYECYTIDQLVEFR